MTTSDWNTHVAAWSHPPVDDVGYVSSAEMLRWSDDKLHATVEQMRRARYGGWRNHENRWRDVMGLDSLTGKDVIDFGCGVGVEALELALADNRVTLADLSAGNGRLAARVLTLYDHLPVDVLLITNKSPYVDAAAGSYDVFYCNGVLHHIRWARSIVERAYELLRPNGEIRLMVYSDVGWRVATNTAPPSDVESHPLFEKFIRFFDAVGEYATWYDENKLTTDFGDLFAVERCEYLTPDDRYLGVVLRRS